MTYYTFHISDSGAIEDIDYKKVNGKTIPFCKMYDDAAFNKLNDILHSTNEYILNKKALNIIKESKTIEYELIKAKVLRKEKLFGFLKKYQSYEYFQLIFPDQNATECYDWIDFKESEIFATDNNGKELKVTSHQNSLDLISENTSDSDNRFTFQTKKVVFGKNFDSEIDLFKIPFYSWGVYVSERLKNKLEDAQVVDIGFAENIEKLGKMWKPHFPIIEFKK